MPGGDGTGPIGRGPMTGRALGTCAGYPNPGYYNPGYGQGYGRGRSRGIGRGLWGRGRRFWYRENIDMPFNQPRIEDEKTYLENMVKDLEEELKSVKDRLQNLIKEKKEPL